MSADTTQKAMPDLTRLCDPASIWPEPSDCPDWPYSGGGVRMDLAPTRDDAEAALANHSKALHGLDAFLREPTKAEVEAAMSRFFVSREPGVGGGSAERLDALGFAGLEKAGGEFGRSASRIVESTHIRGWLRKLAAQEAMGKALQADRAERALKAKVSDYTRVRDGHLAELDWLAEAEARHLQAKEDALAHARCVELRRALRIRFAEAENAARKLGESIPQLPELRYDA